MPFGLLNAAQTLQQFINQVLHNLDFTLAYIDDFIIASTSESEHFIHLNILFTRLSEYSIVIDAPKCVFQYTSLEFLGHTIFTNGISPLHYKVKAIQDFPPPLSLLKLREFLGMINFYRRFIPHYASIIQPLTDLLSPKRTCRKSIQLTDDAMSAFQAIKPTLVDATLLTYPYLQPADTRYSTFNRELLAINHSIRHFRIS